MAHVFVMMEGQRKYLTEFENYLMSKEYMSQLPNQPGMKLQPNVREVKLYDISVFESNLGQLYEDLAPFNSIDHGIKGHLQRILKFGRKIIGLKDPPSSMSKRQVKNPRWRDYMGVYVLAEKKDEWINGVEML
ncbi:MAG TPA: hypothetical protein VMX55_04025 [candidate division Zixibacteria bacterium]|nr:hypothetical protein [candidate division Zixibacteria bacterium]